MTDRRYITVIIPSEIKELISTEELLNVLAVSDEQSKTVEEEYGTELTFETLRDMSQIINTLLPILENKTRYLRRDPDADSWHFDILHDNEMIITYREDDPQNNLLEEGWNWGN